MKNKVIIVISVFLLIIVILFVTSIYILNRDFKYLENQNFILQMKNQELEKEISSKPREYYGKYEMSGFEGEFNIAIQNNSINKEFSKDEKFALTTQDINELYEVYTEKWKIEMNSSIIKLKEYLTEEDSIEFGQIQSKWLELNDKILNFEYSFVKNEKYAISRGTSFNFLYQSVIMDTYKKRTIEIKYLIYLIEDSMKLNMQELGKEVFLDFESQKVNIGAIKYKDHKGTLEEKFIEDNVKKYISTNYEDNYKELDLSLEFEIVRNENINSVKFLGLGNVIGATHPNKLYYSINYRNNNKEIEKIKLSDIYNFDDNFIGEFKKSLEKPNLEYQINKYLNENDSEEVEFINTIKKVLFEDYKLDNKEDMLKLLNKIDSDSYLSYTSTFAEKGIYINLVTADVIGGYANIFIDYGSILDSKK